jgi:NADH:ubiquinone oxidoreductase subunit 2 (subunit N)
LGLAASFLGLYVYLRVIMRMFMQPAPDHTEPPVAASAPGAVQARVAGALCLAATLGLAVAPGWLFAQF